MSDDEVKGLVIAAILGLLAVGFSIGCVYERHAMQVKAVKAGVGGYDENSEFKWKTSK